MTRSSAELAHHRVARVRLVLVPLDAALDLLALGQLGQVAHLDAGVGVRG